MHKCFHTLLTTIAMLTALLASKAGHAEPIVVAYVPNWIDATAFAKTINYAQLTYINIAFENPVNDDGELSFNKQDPALIATAQAHHVKVLVSIGGGSAADDHVLKPRYALLLSDSHRAAFVAKLADYVTQHKLDGLDVDLEGPSITSDYGAFIAELTKALHPHHKLVTAALSKGYGGSKVPAPVFEQLDLVNIMAYDATGPWAPDKPGPSASFAFAQANVQYWLGRGLPKSKAVLGVPFYGHGFGDALSKRGYPFKTIVAQYPGAENADQVGSTIYYNGIPTIKAKAKYVVDEGLAGVMIWSLNDDAPGDKSLVAAIYQTLHGKTEAASKQ